jgi:hypothetical protein
MGDALEGAQFTFDLGPDSCSLFEPNNGELRLLRAR